MQLRAVVAALALSTSFAALPAAATPDLPRSSARSSVTQQVGLVTFTVDYNSPAVRGRTIWGELVPMGEVWRTGADAATRLTADRAFRFGDVEVPAGSYTILTIPGEKSWTVILNQDTTLWGTYGYDQKKDVARIQVKPERRSESRERMTFLFADATHETAALDFEWEKVRVRIPLAVDTHGHVAAEIDSAVKNAWRGHAMSARWLLENDGDLEKVVEYAEASIAIQPTWLNHWVKAQALARQGKKALAVESARAADSLGKGDRIYDGFYVEQVRAAIDDWND